MTAIGEAYDDMETLRRLGAIEASVPVLMEIRHHLRLVALYALVVKRAVLFEELMEARVLIEFIEFVHEVVDVNLSPTFI